MAGDKFRPLGFCCFDSEVSGHAFAIKEAFSTPSRTEVITENFLKCYI